MQKSFILMSCLILLSACATAPNRDKTRDIYKCDSPWNSAYVSENWSWYDDRSDLRLDIYGEKSSQYIYSMVYDMSYFSKKEYFKKRDELIGIARKACQRQ